MDSEGIVFGTFNEKEKKDIPLISVNKEEDIKKSAECFSLDG